MCDERRGIGRRWGNAGWRIVLFAAACGATPGTARGDSGFLQVQFEQLHAEDRVRRADSTFADTSFTLTYWTQNYQYNSAYTRRSDLSLTWQLGFQDRQSMDRLDRSQLPYGNARLTLPTFGLYASVRPATQRTAVQLASVAGTSLDSVQSTEVLRRSTQSLVSGYYDAKGVARLDFSWIRDQRNSVFGAPRAVSDRRDLRASRSVGPLNVHASYGDLATGNSAFKTSPFQRNYGAGGAIAGRPRANMSANLDYDFAGYDRGRTGQDKTRTDTHRTSLTWGWSANPKLSWSLYSWYQRTGLEQRTRRTSDDSESQLYGFYQPSKPLRIQTGAQLRRVAQLERRGWERSLVATASLQSPPRPGMRSQLDASQTVTWNPFRDALGVTTLRASNASRVVDGIDATFDASLAVNNDTIAAGRAVSQGSAGFQLRPLRTLTGTLRGGFYRVGPGLDRLANSNFTGQADLRWLPWPALELFGSLREQRIVDGDNARSLSRAAYVRWLPVATLQLNLNYSRSEYRQPLDVPGRTMQPTHEVVSLQGTWNLDRSRQLTGEASVLDPDQPRESRTYHAAFTWRFGR